MRFQSNLEFDRREKKMRQNYSALYLILAMDERSVGDLTKDKEIEAKVKTSFADDETVDALDISVYSFYGDVYLVGQKQTEAQKKRAIGQGHLVYQRGSSNCSM
jgi:osmotically-inducible protein OsmY